MYEELFGRQKDVPSCIARAAAGAGGVGLRGLGAGPIGLAGNLPRAGSDGEDEPTAEGVADPLAQRLVGEDAVAPLCQEQYRRLAAALHQLHPEGLSSLLVASAAPGEGKTLTAVNLALTFSQSYGREVLLIDADLRRPRLHAVFGIANREGLSEMLVGTDDHVLHPHQVAPRLSLLTAGRATPDPMAGLTSLGMKRVLLKAPETFDWVIVDTPPMAIVPDAGLLASMVDGVLLVVGARATRYEPVRRAVQAVGRSRIVGVVLNRVDTRVLRAQAGGQHRYYQQHAGR